jgi:uncharacterized protein involved in outer membrane biogenesis
MLRKAAIAASIVLVLIIAGVYFWARSVFTNDYVRSALASQLSAYLGQPVNVEGISAGVYPRVTVSLDGVTIGNPSRIRVQSLDIGTNLRALLSGRIEHATVLLDGATIELPLPPLAGSGGDTGTGRRDEAAPVQIVSIDEIRLRNLHLVSGGRSVAAGATLIPHGSGVRIESLTLNAEGAVIEISGELTDLTGPVGRLEAHSDALQLDVLASVLSDFASGAGVGTPRRGPPSKTSGKAAALDLEVAVEAGRARFAGISLANLSGRGRVAASGVRFDPIAFGVFGGAYRGTLSMTSSEPPVLAMRSTLADLDMQALTTFAGSPGSITGRLSGTMDLTAALASPGSVVDAARGSARIQIVNGTVKNLGLVKTIVVSTSGRSGGQGTGTSGDERFARISATLAIAGGQAHTSDLKFESNDLLMDATGAVALDGSAIDLRGKVQLSDELTKQAGRDLVRYTQEGGRVTLPVTVTGSAAAPQVHLDMASATERALTNKATEEIDRAIKRNIGGLFGK